MGCRSYLSIAPVPSIKKWEIYENNGKNKY
jgi:hypothetical protein